MSVSYPVMLNKDANRYTFRCSDGFLTLSPVPAFYADKDTNMESIPNYNALQKKSNQQLQTTPFGSSKCVSYNHYDQVSPIHLDAFLRKNVRHTNSSLDATDVEYTINMVYAIFGLTMQPRTHWNLPVRACLTGAGDPGSTAAILTEVLMECFDNTRDFCAPGVCNSTNGNFSDVPTEGPDVSLFTINCAGRYINDRMWTDIFERWRTPGFFMDDGQCSHPYYMGTPTTRRVAEYRWNRVIPIHFPCVWTHDEVSQIMQERPRILFKAQTMYRKLLQDVDERGSLTELWNELPSFFHHALHFS
jgi:hypothetical protein